jgi:hypothetical protein
MQRFVLLLFLFFSIRIPAQDIDYARGVINALASPALKGRGYVENGNMLAAEYIKKEFTDIGLLPIKRDYFQPFSITVNTFPSKAEIVIDGKLLEPGKDFLIDPSSPSVNGVFDVLLVKKSDLLSEQKVGAVITASAGKILVIDERDFKSDNKEEVKKADNAVQYLKYREGLKNHTIVITSEKFTWSASTVQNDRVCIIMNSDTEIRADSKIALKIDAKLIQYKTANIAGYIPGTSVPDSFLVILAHYDHLGMMGKETLFPGANDNASGVAMMLSLAKYFHAHPLNCSMLFIALSAEELGVLGARYFVDNPLIDLKKIKFLVNFDLAGTGEEGIKVVNGSVYRDKFDLLKKLNDQQQYLKSVQVRGAACNSDHCMFYDKNVPCFYIYTLGGIQAYHDIYDRAETLPLTEFNDYCKLMIDFFNNIF